MASDGLNSPKSVRLGALSGALLLMLFAARPASALQCAAPPPPPSTPAPCYVAFVHGSGTDDTATTDVDGWSSREPGTSENYWWGDRNASDVQYSFTYRGSGQHLGPAAGCAIRRIRYDGNAAFFNGAVQVASELNDWFCNVPEATNVVVVTHSMGGLVMRWILNHSANPQDPSYQPFWNELSQRLKYVITVQAPHTGSPSAAALWGSSPSDYQNAIGDIVNFFGIRSRNEGHCSEEDQSNCASWYMQPSVLQDASVPDGWMGDAFRTTTLFTVGSDSVGFDSGNEESEDIALLAAWELLFGNSDGGDGLVDRPSAQAFNPATQDWIPGALATWLDMKANHHQGRHDDFSGPIWDRLADLHTSNYPGSYIGENGMNLPWSALNQDQSR